MFQGESLAPSFLRTAYNRWVEDNTEDGKHMPQRVFKAHMQARGWTLDRNTRRWVRPPVEVTRTNWGELARLSSSHEPTADDIAANQAELDVIAAEERAQAVAGGYPSVEAMHEHESEQRQSDSSAP